MGTVIRSKLNLLHRLLPPGGVITLQCLERNGISQELSRRYVKSGWLTKLGAGAFKKPDDDVDWQAALSAIQMQLSVPLHVGAKSALELKGLAQYIKLGFGGMIFLFGNQGAKKLPKWFTDQNWKHKFHVTRNNLFPKEFEGGLTKVGSKPREITVSSPERAALEMLYLIPKKQSWEEADLIFENLRSLRSRHVQAHLEKCSSIKVKRLFLFFANRHNHSWLEKLDLSKVSLGSGKREIAKKGRLDKRYQITVPTEFFQKAEQ